MRDFLTHFCLVIVLHSTFVRANSEDLDAKSKRPLLVTIPYMERAGFHRQYADALLKLALDVSVDKYGPYKIVQQRRETVIRRQLLDLQIANRLSVAVSMPTHEWLEKTQLIQFPIMKGLASYRLFLGHSKNQAWFSTITSLRELKQIKIGQGQGWSTGELLEANDFQVVYGGGYETLIPMLNSDRFQLLMRGVYEIGPELKTYQAAMPELTIIDDIALFTYLPMYFFVSKHQPLLAERLDYGLNKAFASGAVDKLFNHYFNESIALLDLKSRHVFYLKNTNIDTSYFEHDKPYLIATIRRYGEAQIMK